MAVGLSALGQRLDETAHWTHVLSPGEQQRLAIARALLIKPDWLFLDETTAALEAYHTRVITVDREAGHPGVLRAEPSISAG
jgi:ABC-type uncharacterized transport system fused permease/ATPase subunit